MSTSGERIMEELSREARQVLRKLREVGGTSQLHELGMDQSAVMRGVLLLQERELVKVEEEKRYRLLLTEEGKRYAEVGLPERRILKVADGVSLEDACRLAGLEKEEAQIGIGWLRRKGLATLEGGILRLTDKGRNFLERPMPEEEALRRLREELVVTGLDSTLEELRRRGLLEVREEKTRILSLTEAGWRVELGPEVEEISELTPELLSTGAWRTARFKRYNVLAPVSPLYPAKLHPQQRVIEEVREILIGMGFKEIPSRIVETEFWNFDALFQAQDHPAREIHDTLSISKPSHGAVPEELLRKVTRAHERGVAGSCGWGYRFNPEISRRLLLCSQTTAATVHFLAGCPSPPVKVFCIGRVFRHEKIDYKHLAEFYQCEGIVMDRGLTLRDMFGYLKEIVRRLGFEKVRFRPSYFPYTEPSAEALVYHEGRGEWIEILGAGMFRPELLVPLGIRYPVLAWGIGLTRLIMLKLGVEDIRMLFSNDLKWLRES
jgi:phenylalanyl-tRNA synthetase alpha chain